MPENKLATLTDNIPANHGIHIHALPAFSGEDKLNPIAAIRWFTPRLRSVPSDAQIAAHLAYLGLTPEDRYFFGNDLLAVTDVSASSDNVLLDDAGNLRFIDPLIRLKKPCEANAQPTRPVLFFPNQSATYVQTVCDGFNAFFNTVSFQSTWIGAFG